MQLIHLTLLAATESHEATSESGAAVLGVKPLAIILQTVTFLILFLVFKKFVLAKVVHTLEERRLTIEEGLKNAHEIEEAKRELATENEVIARKAREDAEKVIAKSHEEAGAIVANAATKAEKQAQAIVEKAHIQVQADVAAAREELRSELLGLVGEATEAVIDVKLDASGDKQLIEKSLRGIDTKGAANET